jgi:hypothetical protein
MRVRNVVMALGAMLLAVCARAEVITYRMLWTPVAGSPADGYVGGLVTLDTARLPAVSYGSPDWADFRISSGAVLSLEVNVTGSFVQNATYGMDDFDRFIFWTLPGLDLHRELVGQDLGNGLRFGQPVPFDSNVLTGNVALEVDGPARQVPSSTWWFTLDVQSPMPDPTTGGGCCSFVLASMAPAVPELASAACFLLGLAGLLAAGGPGPGRRHRTWRRVALRTARAVAA